jgi:hypothetical protein
MATPINTNTKTNTNTNTKNANMNTNIKTNNSKGNNSISQNTNQNPVSNKANSAAIEAGEGEFKAYEVITDNYVLIMGITVAIIVIIIIYFFSETFRVRRSISNMTTYTEFLTLKSLDYARLGNTRIGDYAIASAYNAAHAGYQMYDYSSEKIVLQALRSGARYLEFNIFNSEYGEKAFPVVSMGYKQGEWKMMIKDTPLELILEIIAENAFKLNDGAEGVDNPDDPLFIGLNLNTNSNLACLNMAGYLLTQYLGSRFLSNKYSFQNSDEIAEITMNEAMGKVIIFSSDGFQGSGLEEIVNYSWDNTTNNPNHALRRLHYTDITAPGFNKQDLINFNKTGFTIIIPHKEGDFLNTNYNPIPAFEMGCQFVAMEYQYIDNNMDYYITKFKNNSMVMKDRKLQKNYRATRNTSATSTTTANTTTTTRAATATTTTRAN